MQLQQRAQPAARRSGACSRHLLAGCQRLQGSGHRARASRGAPPQRRTLCTATPPDAAAAPPAAAPAPQPAAAAGGSQFDYWAQWWPVAFTADLDKEAPQRFVLLGTVRAAAMQAAATADLQRSRLRLLPQQQFAAAPNRSGSESKPYAHHSFILHSTHS